MKQSLLRYVGFWLAVVLAVGCGGGSSGGPDTGGVVDSGVAEEVGTPDPGGADTAPLDPGTESSGETPAGDPGTDVPAEVARDPGQDPAQDPGPDPAQDPGEEHGWDPGPDQGPDVCEPPSFSEDCSLVTEFQCGFLARCESGVLLAEWHHHWFCDGEEHITPFKCSYACPHGCEDGEIQDWPPNGATFVETNCFQCSLPGDCVSFDHPACVGYWTCKEGRCGWVCDSECVGEGGSVPVVPNAPKCCPGLVKVPCDAPGPDGECQTCAGAAICTYCGNGVCGPGENECNCPQDCTGCLGLGGQFMDFETEGKCCEGLVPMDDCVPSGLGCACPDCPCHICLPCGDGICGPYENECNCPLDCKVQECVGEGGSVPVVPDAPECCEGLVKVPCDAPGPDGECQMCLGASLCTRCGDGKCGIGENECNCPQDCPAGCLPLGGTFLDFNTSGKCCPGLQPVSDCQIGLEDQCSCPKCPCYICLPCGDGVCGPYEHLCNCAKDCPTAQKCVDTKKSDCLGNPYESPPEGKLKVEVKGHDIVLHHDAVVLNCCLETTVCFTPRGYLIEVVEKMSGGAPCFCECLFNIEATLAGFKSGFYELSLFNEEQGKVLFKTDVEVP